MLGSKHKSIFKKRTIKYYDIDFNSKLTLQGLHLNTQHLQNVGSDFCEALNGLNDNASCVDVQLTKDLNGLVNY